MKYGSILDMRHIPGLRFASSGLLALLGFHYVVFFEVLNGLLDLWRGRDDGGALGKGF